MASAAPEVTYLDTHVVAWLYGGHLARLSPRARRRLERGQLRVSPAVVLELEYLFEIGRVRERAADVVADLAQRLGLAVCDRPFAEVAARACDVAWTRDAFDRLIVAQASLGSDRLLTRDGRMQEHYSKALW